MAGGFTLTTQLSISQSEISKIKDTIAKGVGGKGGLNTFTTQIKLSLAASEIAKIDKLLKGSFKVRPVELSFTANRKSRALIAADLGSYTALRPIPVHLTVSSRSFTDIKRKISASFKSGGTSAARIPIAPTASSLTVVRDFFEKGLATRPIKLPVMASGLAAMHRQITSYFASRPVSINVTPNVSPSPTTRSTRRNASNGFQPTNKLEAGGVKIAKAIEHYGAFTTAVGTFVSLFRAMDDAVKEAIKFDREMIRVSQVTGVSTSGLKDLSEEIGRVSKAYGVSSSEILKSTVTLSQAGLSAKDTKIALEAIAKTGVSATFGDINDTTEASIAIFQQFGKNASELESILSSVNKVSGAFAIESDDITVAVRRAGGAFKAAGGNFTEFMALFTSVRQTTRESAETIATGFRTIFARLQRTSTQNFLKTLGIELLDEGQFVGPYKAIMRIADALKEVQTTDPRFAQIVEELGGFRQVEKVIPLLTQTAVSQRALSIAMRGGTSLTEDAVVAQESLEVQLNKLKQTFLDVIRAFSNNYSIKFIIKSMIELTTVTLELVKALSSIAPVLATLGVLSFAKSAGSIRKGFSGYFGFASGGTVPGTGNSDTVPAMLTPGEFVLRKSAVNKIGVDKLNKINNGNVAGYNSGGVVKFASGGSVSASDKLKTFASNPLFIAALASAFARLSTSADEFNDKLVSAISSLASGIAQIGAIKLALDSFKNKFRGANIPFVGSVGFDEDKVRRNHLSAEQFRIRQEERRDHLARIATLRSTGTYSVPAHRISKYTQRENTNRRLTLEAPRNSFAFARADRERYDERRDALMSKVAVASTIGVVVSSILKSIEDNKVNSGNGNAYSGAAASALGGAAVGAYVGSSFGPYGAIAGALIGGAGTFVTTLDDMSNKIKLVGIEKTFSDLDERLKKVISGKLSVESQLSFIPDSILSTSSQIGSLKSMFDGIFGTKERDDILARFKNDQSGFEKFFELVARSSSSMDDFNNKTKGTLAVFSSLSGIKFNELNDSVRKIIESNSKLADIEAKRSVIIQSELDTRVRLISLESAINAAFSGANSLDISSGRAKSRLSGQFDYTEKFDIESIIRSVGEGRFSNTGLAGSLIKNVGANLGEGGKSDVSLANNVIGLPKRLPEILNRLYSQDKLGTKDSFIDRFSNEIGNIPLDIKRSMIAALNEVIGEEGKEANLFEKIEEDLDGVVSKLTKSVQPLFKTFSDFASKIQEQERRIVSSLSVYSDIFQELIENNQKLRDSQRDYTDFINSINGRSPSLSDIVSRRGTDLTSNFGSSSAIDLATRKRMIDEEIDSLNKQRDANLGNIEQFQKLSIAINNLENQSLMAAKGLSNIADDSSNYITSLKQLIEKTRQENQIRSDFAKTLGSGSKDERRNLSKDIFNTALAIKGGLNSIPINEQGAVIEFLQKQGNLSVFGGKGGRETANKLLTDSIVQNSGRNISEEQARRFVENKPKSIDDMLKQLDIAYAEQRTALTSIGVNLVTEGDKLRQAIQKSSSEIVTTLIDIQKQNESSKTESKKNELEKERALLQNRLAATNRVSELTGFGTDFAGIDKARSLSTLLSDRLALSEKQKALTSPLNSNIKFSGPMQTIDGAVAMLESEIAKNIEGFSFSDNLKNTARGMRRTEFDAPRNNRYGSDRGLLEKYAMSEIEIARKKAIRQNLDSLELSRDAFKGYGLDTSKIGEIDTLKSLLNQIGDKDIKSAAELQLSIDKLTKAINELNIPGRATGGFIGGVGNRDSVPAMLMPGEYVLRKAAVKKIGVHNLDKMNNGMAGYSSGGNVVANAARNVKKEIQDRILSGQITKEQAIAFTERANELDRQARKEAAKMKYEEQRTAIRDKNANSIVSAYSKIGTDKDSPYFTKLRDQAKAAGATKTPLAGFKIQAKQYSEDGIKDANRTAFLERKLFRESAIQPGKSGNLFIGEGLVEQDRLARDEYRKEYARNVLQPRLEASSGKGTPRVLAGPAKQMVQPVAQRISESPEQQRRRILQQKINFSNATGQPVQEQVKSIAGINNFQEFNKNSANLATAMKEFPSELTLNANHKIEVIFNGAEVLKGMVPAMQEIAVKAANNSLRRYAEMHNLPRAMPVGTVNGNKVS